MAKALGQRLDLRFTCLDVAQAAGLRRGPRHGCEQRYHCSRHNDQHPSLSINIEKNVWMCGPCGTSGTPYQLAAFLANADPTDSASVNAWLRDRSLLGSDRNGQGHVASSSRASDVPSRIWAVHAYTNEKGELLHEVVRYRPKSFKQRKPDGNGGWIWSVDGVRRVLYNLKALQGQQKAWIVEGERDVETLVGVGLVATCNRGGAGKWTRSDTQQLVAAGIKTAVVLPDNDQAGQDHAIAVAIKLTAASVTVKLVQLPDLPPKGDVSDFLAAGSTVENLIAIAEAAPTWTRPASTAASPSTSGKQVERLTEAGAAERFVQLHGQDLHFDHRRKFWRHWHGHRWQQDVDSAISRLGLNFVRDWQRSALEISDHEQRAKILSFALKLERRDALNSMLAFAGTLKPVADSGDGWDANPWLLGAPNGVIDLKTGALRGGRRNDRITMQTAVAYDPDAQCPRWERFLSEVFNDDLDMVEFVRRAVGYSITGSTTEQFLVLLYGEGANGKSTLLQTLRGMLGDYAYNMPFSTMELQQRSAIPNDVAALAGRRFVISSETQDGARLNESRIKALTGGDPITARFLHAEHFTFEPVGKFWLAVNHRPTVHDDSHGFWRRIRLVPFTRKFEVNPRLGDELRDEAVGILAWAVRACIDWQRDGLSTPSAVTDATKDYSTESDQLGAFLADVCELVPLAEVQAAQLFELYEKWADAEKFSARERLTRTMFGRKLGERFKKVKRDGRAWYQGLSKRQAPEPVRVFPQKYRV